MGLTCSTNEGTRKYVHSCLEDLRGKHMKDPVVEGRVMIKQILLL
jgi:hypothetical protein